MLVLSRKPGEEIIINNNIKVSVVSIKGDRVRIGIEAPKHISVDRAEIHSRRVAFFDIPVNSTSIEDSVIDLGNAQNNPDSVSDTIVHSKQAVRSPELTPAIQSEQPAPIIVMSNC